MVTEELNKSRRSLTSYTGVFHQHRIQTGGIAIVKFFTMQAAPWEPTWSLKIFFACEIQVATNKSTSSSVVNAQIETQSLLCPGTKNPKTKKPGIKNSNLTGHANFSDNLCDTWIDRHCTCHQVIEKQIIGTFKE